MEKVQRLQTKAWLLHETLHSNLFSLKPDYFKMKAIENKLFCGHVNIWKEI